MREKGSQSINTNQRRSIFRGGETRVMKRILSSLLVFALVLTMLVPAFAFAAEKTTDEKFNELKALGLLNGVEDGSAGLDRELSRAELAAVLVRLFKLEPVTGKSEFTDVTDTHWAQKEGVIGAAAKAGYMGSTSTTQKLFAPDAKLTIEELATVVVRVLKLPVNADAKVAGASDWAGGYVEAALKAGLIKEATNYAAKANRGMMVDAGYTAYQATVTPVATGATKVVSVKADNLKQVVVTFDGDVDATSAENVDNYSSTGLTFAAATLQEDGKSVVLDLASGFQFTNQKAIKLTVDGVKSTTEGNYVAKATITFAPIDVTIPTVKEVVALGTKALQVVFSEPVKYSQAKQLLNYKIDGKSLSGFVDPANYTDDAISEVVINSTMTTGSHKLSVSNIEDFYGLKVNVADLDFAVAEDAEAPTVVTATSVDLTKVVVEFNEPVKKAVKAYHSSPSKTVVPTGLGTKKLTFNFPATDKLALGNNTITIVGVEDYSGNKADRTATVNAQLDTERPTVTGVKVEKAANVHKVTVSFSESVVSGISPVNPASSEYGPNYTFKSEGGTAAVVAGLNTKGNPVSGLSYNSTNKEVTITLNGLFDAGKYTLTVAGIQDLSVVANTMLPYTAEFEIGDTSPPSVSQVWFEQSLGYNLNGTTVYDYSFYVQYDEAMAVEGSGNVTDRNKYNFADNATFDVNGDLTSTPNWYLIPNGSSLEMVSPEVLKISFTSSKDYTSVTNLGLRVALVSDTTGNYLGGTTYLGYAPISQKTSVQIPITKVAAVAKDTVKVTFGGILYSIDASEFKVNGKTVYYDSHTVSGGSTIVTFKLAAADAWLTGTPSGALTIDMPLGKSATFTQDAFGNTVKLSPIPALVDNIKPEYDSFTVSQSTYNVTVTFDDTLAAITPGAANELVSVKIDGYEVKVTGVSTLGSTLIIDLENTGNVVTRKGTTATVTVSAFSNFEVSVKDANDVVKVITDNATVRNTVVPFTDYGNFTSVMAP